MALALQGAVLQAVVQLGVGQGLVGAQGAAPLQVVGLVGGLGA